jgi:hypothetical protein
MKGVKKNTKKNTQLRILNNLKPFFEDSANYFGIYEEDIRKICRKMGWNRKE